MKTGAQVLRDKGWELVHIKEPSVLSENERCSLPLIVEEGKTYLCFKKEDVKTIRKFRNLNVTCSEN